MTTPSGKIVTLAELISVALVESGSTQRELSQFIGVAPATLNTWIKGNKLDWDMGVIYSMSEFFYSKVFLFDPEQVYRRRLDTLEEYREYIPLTLPQQAKYMGMSLNKYRELELTHIDHIQRFKEMVNEHTMFKLRRQYY